MKPPPLSVFALHASDDDPAAFLGDTGLHVLDIAEDDHVIAECDYAALALASLDSFPDALCIKVHSSDGFGTFLFHEVDILRDDTKKLVADFMCIRPNKYWEGRWGLATFLKAIGNQVRLFPSVDLREIELEDDWKRLTLRLALGKGPAVQAVRKCVDILKKLIRESEIALGGIRWQEAYATNERAFLRGSHRAIAAPHGLPVHPLHTGCS